jgi:hypothetical protein
MTLKEIISRLKFTDLYKNDNGPDASITKEFTF